MTATVVKFHRTARLECSACGASAEAACDCGASYVPAHTQAAKAVAKNPEKSNRAISAETGIPEPTIRRARQATASNDAVEGRVGLDGKARKMPKPSARRSIDPGLMPTDEEAEESWQETIYDQACLLLERMADETRKRFFVHIRRKYREN